jgi:hypothetical protein
MPDFYPFNGLVQPLPDKSVLVQSPGTADAAPLINQAFAAAGPYGVVRLVPGSVYNTFTPIIPPAGSTLTGAVFGQATQNDFAALPTTTGTIIRAAPAFSGAAVIQQVNATGNAQTGMNLSLLTIEGNQLPAASGIHGILIDGLMATGSLFGVMVHRPDGDCLHAVSDPGFLSNPPDDWQVAFCKFSSSRSGYGVYCASFTDTWFTSCEASENKLDNWNIFFSGNMRLIGCKGENSFNGAGYHFRGGGATTRVTLDGCTTNLNNQDGFLFTGTTCTYALTGCHAGFDGQAGGTTYAGFRANGSAARVILTGCTALTNATGPAYGAAETGASFEVYGLGCLFQGVTAATFDDGTNTHALVSASPVPF